MTDPDKYTAIIARLEALTGSHHVVNARISVLCGDIIMKKDQRGQICFFRAPLQRENFDFLSGCADGEDDAYVSLAQCKSVKNYTGSVDACIALIKRVLPIASVEMSSIDTGFGIEYKAGIRTRLFTSNIYGESKHLLAIALLLATFKALQAQEQTDG